MLVALKAISLAALAMGVASCGQADVQARASNAITCITRWRGELPLRDSEIILRACLTEGLCSRPLTANLDANVGIDPSCAEGSICKGSVGPVDGYVDDVSLEARWEGAGSSQGSIDRLYDLTVTLVYGEDVSQRLAETDRATLFIEAATGEMLAQSMSAVPYAETILDGHTCKGATLNLDGTSASD